MTANEAIEGILEKLRWAGRGLAVKGETAAYAFTTHRASEKDVMGAAQTV